MTYHIDRSMPGRRGLGQWPDRPPPAHKLAGLIRFLATESDRIDWAEHAHERMEERDITVRDALRVLRNGDIEGAITPGRSQGKWQCKVVFPIKGSREAGVATVVIEGERLFVKTVEWEDPS